MEPKELQLLQKQNISHEVFLITSFMHSKELILKEKFFLILNANFRTPLMSIIKFRVHGNWYSSAKLVKEHVYTIKEFW